MFNLMRRCMRRNDKGQQSTLASNRKAFAESHLTNAALTAGVHAVIDKSECATTLISSIQQLLACELPPPGAA